LIEAAAAGKQGDRGVTSKVTREKRRKCCASTTVPIDLPFGIPNAHHRYAMKRKSHRYLQQKVKSSHFVIRIRGMTLYGVITIAHITFSVRKGKVMMILMKLSIRTTRATHLLQRLITNL
jgi:hypothetical protein